MKRALKLSRMAGVLLIFVTASRAAIDSPRVECDRWPSAYTIEGFAQDVIRIEKAHSEEEQVLALFKWNQRVMRHGYGYQEGPSPEDLLRSAAQESSRQWEYAVIDPVKILNVYGEGWCDTRSRLFHALCIGAGLTSETVSVFDPKVRVWYQDGDGQARWHFFDPFRSWYVYTRDRARIASYEDIVADPSLLTNPSQTSIPYSYTSESNHTCMFKEDGSIYPQMPHTSFKLRPGDYHGMDIRLRRCERYRLAWSPDGKYYGPYELFGEKHSCTNGPHSHIFTGPGTEHTTFASGVETVIDPVNWPFVQNYYHPCDNPACPFNGLPVKWYGNGLLTYEPNLDKLENFRDGLYSWGSYRNLAFGKTDDGAPRVRVDQTNQDAWLTFRVDTPYVIADATIEGQFMVEYAEDTCAISLSADKGDTWQEVWRSTKAGITNVAVNIGQTRWRKNEISAVSQYGFLVRVDFKSAATGGTGMDWLRITSNLELNMFTLPMLQPGQNRIHVGVNGRDTGDKLRVTYCWDDHDGKARRDQHIVSGVTQDYTIRTSADKVEDITMRYLELENLP